MVTTSQKLRLSVRHKIIFGLVIVFAASFAAIAFLSHKIILLGFEKVERQYVETRANSLDDSFNLQAENLENKFVDWAIWDDAYEYLSKGHKSFEKSTLAPESLISAKIDLLGWRLMNGRWRWIKKIDASLHQVTAPSSELLNYLSEQKELFLKVERNKPVTGILNLPTFGLSFLTVQQVSKSNGLGENLGHLIVIRKIDEAMLSRINQLTHLKSSMQVFTDKKEMTTEFLNVSGVNILSDTKLEYQLLLKDIYAHSVARITFQVYRDFYAQGKKSLNYVFWITSIIGLIFMLAIWSMLKLIVVKRLLILTRSIEEIESLKEAEYKIQPLGTDELGRLAEAINRFLSRLHKANLKAKIENEKSIHLSKLATLGEMSAGIAHEINNPLGIVMGNMHILEKYRENPEVFKNKLSAIHKATGRIEKIVKGLKKYSRTNDNAHMTLVNIDHIVNEALVLVEVNCKRNNVLIETDLNSSSKILADEVEIEQVIVNLINNSIHAVKELNPAWIKVKSFDNDGETILQVIDSGQGIDPSIEFKIFQPFYTTKSVGDGTGLGLSIVKGILDQHDAQIKINRQYVNTCFEVRFKIKEKSQDAA